MVQLVREWGDGYAGDDAVGPQALPIPADIPAGHTLVIAFANIQGTESAPVVSDSAGNDWVLDLYSPSGASTTRHITAHAQITKPLTTADTINVDLTSTNFRVSWSVTEWDALLTVADSHFDDPANSTSVQSSELACPSGSVLVSTVCLRNPGRTPTAVAPTEITTRYASLAGSSNRAVWQQYRVVDTAGPARTESTLDSGGGFSIYSLALAPASAPSSLGGAVVVDGTLREVTDSSVIVGGSKRAVKSMSVILQGVKHPI